MLSIHIKVIDINYEKTFQQIFPMIQNKINEIESNHVIIRLFQKLDDASLPILLGIMERLPKDTKDELLKICLNTYSDKICELLNTEISNHPYGQYIKIGYISSIMQEKEVFYLIIDQLQIDYKKLVKEKISGKMGQFASLLVSDKLEKLALELFWSEDSKQKMIQIAQDTLEKYGFFMTLTDIQLMKNIKNYAGVIQEISSFTLSDKIETDIIDALAGYLKDKESMIKT